MASFAVLRVALMGVTLALIAFLLWRGGLPDKFMWVLVAALVLYVIRLWIFASKLRRERAERRRIEEAEALDDR